MGVPGLEARLTALEAEVAALRQQPPSQASVASPKTWWLLEKLGSNPAPDGGGTLAYGGLTSLPGAENVMWQAEHSAASVLGVDAAAVAPVLAALGHPVRLELLRRMLGGASTLAELQQVPGARTTGQVHHHLRELRTAGLITAARNSFAVVPERVVPVLVICAAAAGPGNVSPAPSQP